MARKLEKNTLPAGHGRDDFEGFGPVVVKDTEWGSGHLCDLGCFKQDEGVDSNKYYHLAVVKSKKNGQWFAYYEWGRTKPDGRPSSPAFQFFECSSEQEAIATCEDQFRSKNTKRGVWESVAGKQRFVPKPKKGGTEDLYVVRPLATRLVGLPCCENIANEDAKKQPTGNGGKAAAKTPAKRAPARKVDRETEKLFRDLIGGAVTYSKTFLGSTGPVTLPSQQALDEGREILDDAMKRLAVVGDDLNDQIADRDLNNLTKVLHGRIPKNLRGATPSQYMLSKDNVLQWQRDIDVLETALNATDMHIEEETSDVMQGIPAEVHYIPQSDPLFQYLVGEWNGQKHAGWWPNATRYRSGTGNAKLRIHHLWAVERHGDKSVMRQAQEKTLGEMPKTWNNERPLFQDKQRPDLNAAERKLFWDCNTALMFHGTRSVNVPGIVRENLRFPKELSGVVITGAMFGPGSYFADDWSKSAGYCSHPRSIWGGGGNVRGRKSFMFAFDVICGNPHVAPGPRGYTSPPAGHHCVFGKAGHSQVANNEWILYQKGRIEMRYLAEIEW